jgi:hypothetical protein
MRLFDFIEGQLGQIIKRRLSPVEDQDIDQLMKQAASTGADVKRTLDRCKNPPTDLAFNYEGKPPAQPRAK